MGRWVVLVAVVGLALAIDVGSSRAGDASSNTLGYVDRFYCYWNVDVVRCEGACAEQEQRAKTESAGPRPLACRDACRTQYADCRAANGHRVETTIRARRRSCAAVSDAVTASGGGPKSLYHRKNCG